MVLTVSSIFAFVFIVIPALVASSIYFENRSILKHFRRTLKKGQSVVIERDNELLLGKVDARFNNHVYVRLTKNGKACRAAIENVYPVNYYQLEEESTDDSSNILKLKK